MACIRLAGCAAFVLAAFLCPESIKPALFLVAFLIAGSDIILAALANIAKGNVFNENLLMTLSAIGAFLLREYPEGVAVLFLFRIGEMMEEYAVQRSRKSISALLELRPDTATIQRNGREERIPAASVLVGDTILVAPGERIPLDGIVLSGISDLDVSMLTGESTPVAVETGAAVSGGCINLTGLLAIRVTRSFSDSTASRIIALAQDAIERKSKSETMFSKWAKTYTPFVFWIAFAIGLVLPLLLLSLGKDPAWEFWIYRSLAFLAVSCPCALVISIPLCFFCSLGAASNGGILVKGSCVMERLPSLKTIAFDKTGTLTNGRLSVSALLPVSGISETELLEKAALLECHSTHPIATGILRHFNKPINSTRIADLEEQGGRGITAAIDGKPAAAGNARLMKILGISIPDDPPRERGSLVYVAEAGKLLGCICLQDTLKPDIRNTLAMLRGKLGAYSRFILLSGDNPAETAATAAESGIERFAASLLPADKLSALSNLQKQRATELPESTVAFVGDGINDAPVLAQADIGIAMGAQSSDAAMEAADIVLMDGHPRNIATALDLARRCRRILRQCIMMAIGCKAACLLLVALGKVGLFWAVFSDVGILILCILNALRCQKKR
ncbi:MAG: heavy metal translocating P-type ATPase [Kiritimatiellia bacterium]